MKFIDLEMRGFLVRRDQMHIYIYIFFVIREFRFSIWKLYK